MLKGNNADLLKFYRIITLTNKPPISSSTLIWPHWTVEQYERVVLSPWPVGHHIQDVILCITYYLDVDWKQLCYIEEGEPIWRWYLDAYMSRVDWIVQQWHKNPLLCVFAEQCYVETTVVLTGWYPGELWERMTISGLGYARKPITVRTCGWGWVGLDLLVLI